MKYSRVFLEAIGYVLPTNIITSSWIEERLRPLYQRLYLQPGQLEALTGIKERRWWNPDHINSREAANAARRTIEESGVPVSDIGALIYAGVCRDDFEPATACAVASNLGIPESAIIYDISNACLGVMNGILDIANRIELGQIKAGLVVSCETAREITMIMIERMIAEGTMEFFKKSLATLTGGSGAAAVLLTDGSYSPNRPRLLGGTAMAAPQHHRMCRWGFDRHNPPRAPQMMETDAIGLLNHGKALLVKLAQAFYEEMQWTRDSIDRVIPHQVANANRLAILEALGLPPDKDYCTFPYLGNMGTVSLPITAAIASERGALLPGQRVVFMGIGSGLNSLMLGWKW